jgi:hypothetical protein
MALNLREDTTWENNKAPRLKMSFDVPLHVRRQLVELRERLGLTYTMTVALAVERMVAQLNQEEAERTS